MFSSLPISKSVSRGASRGKAEKHGDWRERRKRSPCTHRCRGESKPDWGDLRIGVAFAASCRRKSARKHAPSLVGRARRGSTERKSTVSHRKGIQSDVDVLQTRQFLQRKNNDGGAGRTPELDAR